MNGLRLILSRLKLRRGRPADPRLRMLAWAALATLAFGAIELGEPVEDGLRVLRSAIVTRAPSGRTVIVAVDERSIREVGAWPWPRRRDAELLDRLQGLGAGRVFFDIDFSPTTTAADDRAFETALSRSASPVVLAVRFLLESESGRRTDNFPLAAFRRHARLANINFWYAPSGTIWKLPYALDYGGKAYASMAATLAGAAGPAGRTFPIDYSIDARAIPTLSAVDVLRGRVPAAALAGRDVVVGVTSPQWGDQFFVPGKGRLGGVYVHVLGAETLRRGMPVQPGWIPPFLLALLLAGIALTRSKVRYAMAVLTGTAAALLAAPVLLEGHGVYCDVVPALFLLLWVGTGRFRRAYRLRGATNAVSGLPNLGALRGERCLRRGSLVVVKVRNYAEICSALPPNRERELVDQIARRLRVGFAERVIYQGDEGVFAWAADGDREQALREHVEALHALFRTPVAVAGRQFDLAVAFGIDADTPRSVPNRLASALVAAEEAAAEGRRWKQHDPEKLKDSDWKLSLLSQLDRAIELGHLWVAYQAKLDLVTRRIVGAEALVRWSHPEKGEIGPVEFIPAAEQNGRIEKLTVFVLDDAIRAAAMIGERDRGFGISVNLSARLIESLDLVNTVEGLLRRHSVPADRLTLEVTETAALTTGASSMDALFKLRAMGVQISIDDYGTGLSTLEYLKRIPATEIKVDKSFVQSIYKSQSDKLMVHSTIQLAHSLGQKVVAEGVEDIQTLEALTYMGCDIAQGFHIGRPMPFRAFWRSVLEQKSRRAA
ncbi:MAG TPA: EAL domain-containing protein [Allosphingosinicella sp.]|jgi:EAL domain-containing protein (putative c-di-GMP-specific phosphodiesterase class I)/CHASE2 domain-containing sensor protein